MYIKQVNIPPPYLILCVTVIKQIKTMKDNTDDIQLYGKVLNRTTPIWSDVITSFLFLSHLIGNMHTAHTLIVDMTDDATGTPVYYRMLRWTYTGQFLYFRSELKHVRNNIFIVTE